MYCYSDFKRLIWMFERDLPTSHNSQFEKKSGYWIIVLPCGLQHAAAGQSSCLVSIKGQSRGDWADCIVAGGHRAKRPELRLQILCRFHKCLIIVLVCLLAFIHVCGLVSVWWCHSMPIIDSCRFIFSVLPVWPGVWLLQAPALARGHSIR